MLQNIKRLNSHNKQRSLTSVPCGRIVLTFLQFMRSRWGENMNPVKAQLSTSESDIHPTES